MVGVYKRKKKRKMNVHMGMKGVWEYENMKSKQGKSSALK